MKDATVSLADAKARLSELVEASFAVLRVSCLDLHTAGRFADQYTTGLCVGDALHLAIAYNHGARVRTLDRTLLTAASALGVSAELL